MSHAHLTVLTQVFKSIYCNTLKWTGIKTHSIHTFSLLTHLTCVKLFKDFQSLSRIAHCNWNSGVSHAICHWNSHEALPFHPVISCVIEVCSVGLEILKQLYTLQGTLCTHVSETLSGCLSVRKFDIDILYGWLLFAKSLCGILQLLSQMYTLHTLCTSCLNSQVYSMHCSMHTVCALIFAGFKMFAVFTDQQPSANISSANIWTSL